jgi:hypothetical protein
MALPLADLVHDVPVLGLIGVGIGTLGQASDHSPSRKQMKLSGQVSIGER